MRAGRASFVSFLCLVLGVWLLSSCGGGLERKEGSALESIIILEGGGAERVSVGVERPGLEKDGGGAEQAVLDSGMKERGSGDIQMRTEEVFVSEVDTPPERTVPPLECQPNTRRCVDGSSFQACLDGSWGTKTTCAGGGVCVRAGVCEKKPAPVKVCVKSCWKVNANFGRCGFYGQQEDFSSGRHNVHQYDTQLHAGVTTEISVRRSAGVWQPAVVIQLSDGTALLPSGSVTFGVVTTVLKDGRQGDLVQIHLKASKDVQIVVYLTSWKVVNSGYVDFPPKDSKYDLQMVEKCQGPKPTGKGIAPNGALSNERLATSASTKMKVGGTLYGEPIRVDAVKGEYIGFRVNFTPVAAKLEMEVLRWDGAAVKSMAITNAGSGLRVLAVLDTVESRTYWVRVKGAATAATLVLDRTPFVEGVRCKSDCKRLLQLPLPNDIKVDGYGMPGHVIYRYQFARRDMIMLIRYAGRAMLAAKRPYFTVKDMSRWDGGQPPDHSSHLRGIDADLSLYKKGVGPVWQSLCRVVGDSACAKGSDTGFDSDNMAFMLGAFFESGRIDRVYIDQEFIPKLISAAQKLINAGLMSASMLARFKDTNVVKHVRSHHHHVHVRVKETPY